MRKELSKLYEPRSVEDKTYKFWEENNCFAAKIDKNKQPYTIVMPPPNITGQLHIGHALDDTLQDIIIRYRRMQGYCALWLPGTDHASIATEARIVEAMKKEGLTKDMIGRDEFLKRAWKWKETYGNRIVSQIKKLGSSCDWSRISFTMDDGCSNAVKEFFVKLYNKGLIYRGERIINWCPTCSTSISDAEVEYEDKQGSFWHLKYPFSDGSGYLELATTRPETMIGDTAVAVNPNDERYKMHIGKMVKLPLFNREIPVIADDYVDMDFGTGVVKITPAHDPNDFEIGVRHKLEILNVMTNEAKINEIGGKYAGLDRYEARNKIVQDLQEAGFLTKIEPHQHNVGTCHRCHTTVEPRVSLQWFVNMEQLAKPAISAIRTGDIKFIPERFEKVYFHWMENIRDWCISRQLWWGHRIPAYYCTECGEIVVSRDAVDICPKCGAPTKQDPDTLDTWFSSALWPFSTFGWPEKTADLEYFYPTTTLVTSYDIITFWVSRMIVAGLELTDKNPFDSILIHGLVRDAEGRKMSKSLDNGVDPIDVIENYGADALRFTLANTSPGSDMRFSEDKVRSSRNFANKLWNATRFILMNLPEDFEIIDVKTMFDKLNIEDKWIINRFNKLAKEVNENLEKFEFGLAAEKLYEFIWDVYCDWYIELTKPRILAGGEMAQNAQAILVWVMQGMLKLLHPFMPFITEEIWQTLTSDGSIIMLQEYPKFDTSISFDIEETEFSKIIGAIKAIRNCRTDMNVPPSVKAELFIETEMDVYKKGQMFFERLAFSSKVEVVKEVNIANATIIIADGARIFIPINQLVDKHKELARLTKELEISQKDVDFLTDKLSNQGFLAKAPEKLIEVEKGKLAKATEKLESIKVAIDLQKKA